MSVMNNWCVRFLVSSLLISTSIILADYKFYFLPINGVWLLLYVLFIIIFTIWILCVDIQKLLQKNVPFEYNFESSKYIKKLQTLYTFLQISSCSSSSTEHKKAIDNGSHTPKTEIYKALDSQPINQQINQSIFPAANNSENNQLGEKVEKSIDERIDLLVSDVEQRFISKWYNLISGDDTFRAESKILLEGIIRRILQVSVQMDSSKLICGALVLLLKHLKEYRKAVKRVRKNGGSVESVYRYSHIGNKSQSALEQFIHRLTANVVREFISWELWNSLPCRLLVSVLSKRLTSYLIFYVSQPGWLNYKILYHSVSKSDILELNLEKYSYISLSDVDLSDKQQQQTRSEEKTASNKVTEKEKVVGQKSVSSTPKMSPKRDTNEIPQTETDSKVQNENGENFSKLNTLMQGGTESVIEQALTKMITQQTATILQRAEKSSSDLKSAENKLPSASQSAISQPAENPFKPKRSEPVKIHSAKSTSKRWDENELSNVSLGQDLLALEALDGSGIQGFSGRRLWGYNSDLNDQENGDKSGYPLWEVNDASFKEREAEKEVVEETKISPKVKSKPGNVTATTLHNMRELQQSTVNNVVRPVSNATEKAIHKIGDLQDEAVGVVEGIFDFGMAGIRKGLRLTGLQDTNTELPARQTKNQQLIQDSVKQSPKSAPKLAKLGHVVSSTDDTKLKSAGESTDSVWINPLAKESPNGYENQMLLERSPNQVENETVNTEAPTEIPDITQSDIYLTDSPEYEETADLASTISKLRSLLQQKSESNLNTPAVSPMPVDDKTLPTPTEPVIADVTRGDGGMQRFARTVTGMFNTFKTALPGNVNEQAQAKTEQWIFVENETSDTDLPSLLNSLLVERRDYCTVDTAYEAMDSLDLLTESVTSQIGKIQWDNQIYEDELDDLETSIPITKALLDIICECMQDTNCALNQEPVMKSLLIIGGSKSERKLSQYSEKILRLINRLIGPLPKNFDDDVMAMNLEKIVTRLEKSLPYYIQEIFGHEDLRTGLKFFISSLQSVNINQDIMLQLFELVCSQLIYASSQMSPTPSA